MSAKGVHALKLRSWVWLAGIAVLTSSCNQFLQEEPRVFKATVIFLCTTNVGTKVDLTLWANQLADVWGLVDKIGQQSAASVYQ